MEPPLDGRVGYCRSGDRPWRATIASDPLAVIHAATTRQGGDVREKKEHDA